MAIAKATCARGGTRGSAVDMIDEALRANRVREVRVRVVEEAVGCTSLREKRTGVTETTKGMHAGHGGETVLVEKVARCAVQDATRKVGT